jgi:glycosyltransferase involved in cell wall biosynthesis
MKRLSALAPRAIFLHHVGPLIYGSIAARLAGVPAYHVEHDVWHYEAPRRRMILSALEQVLPLPHVAVSNHAASVICTMQPRAEVAVIPNGVDHIRFQPRDRLAARKLHGLDPTRRIVGTAGRLVPVKGHDVLVRATIDLPDDVEIVIAGSGPELANLQALAATLGIGHRVRFLGHVDHIEHLLPAFDVFCLPSRNEGMPRSLLEAQASGLPVVATDVGAVREVVCRDTGRVVPPGDSAALALALVDILDRRPTVSPRAFTAERYAWQRTVMSYRRTAEFGHAA